MLNIRKLINKRKIPEYSIFGFKILNAWHSIFCSYILIVFEFLISPYFGVDIIDINTLISKIISTSSLDKNNKKLIDLFLGLNFNIKTYTVNQDLLETTFCELEKFFAEKKQILLGLIDYDFKDVQEIYKSSCTMPRRKINNIIINPDQRKKLSLNKGDRIITLSK